MAAVLILFEMAVVAGRHRWAVPPGAVAAAEGLRLAAELVRAVW